MMTIEIIAIGSEILKGSTVNTNSSEISLALMQAGYFSYRHTVLPDDASLKGSLEECLKRSQLVICTGGLGPTCDDLTRPIAAEIFHSEFHLDQTIGDELKRRYKNLPISWENQATVPTNAFVMPNDVGTAPGLIFSNTTATLVLLPGVPKEMRLMLHNHLIPYLKKHYPSKDEFISKSLYFSDLSESSVDPILRTLQKQYPMIEFGIYPSQGILSVNATLRTHSPINDLPIVNEALEILKNNFLNHHFHAPAGKVENALQDLFIQKGWTLSLAESCTGGNIAARLTKKPGSSHYFLSSLVCYSNQMKHLLLGVPMDLFSTAGAVSKECAIAMVEGLLDKTKTDFGIAITGIAGPDGGSTEKPVGTVFIAIKRKGKETKVRHLQANGSREMIIERSTNAALIELLRYCQKE